jgi:gamma-D-glutamyl-L-lysine dipeptidyl-peptidase
MKRLPVSYFLVLIAAVWTVSCTPRAERTMAELNLLLDSLQTRYAPDARIALWDISVETKDGMTVLLSGEVDSKEAHQTIERTLEEQFPEVKSELLLLPVDGTLVNGLVNNSVIHLRREPSSKKELVTQSLLGTPVRILKEEGGKSLIQVPDGYIGWVNTQEVVYLDEDALGAYKNSDKVIFHAQYGFAFSEKDVNSMPVSDLVIGDILVLMKEGPEFLQVKFPDERLAWVKAKEVVPAEEIIFKTALKENLVQTALKYNGIPYLWGGTSAKNIDCSGLVSNVYFLNGIQLPRDADQQTRIGRELTTEFESGGLEAGDLLFFGRKATADKKERTSHVAMYIGGGEFIHSAGYRERVSINSMDSTESNFIETYPDIFVRAVRILGEEYDGFSPISENKFYKEIIGDKE